MMEIPLGGKIVGEGHACYVVAEIGGNFQTVEQGRHLIDLAAETGADAVKLQTFRADTLTTKNAMFEMENTGVIAQHEYFRKFELSREDHEALFEHASDKGLFAFSTPSHSTDVDLLEELNVGAHKIGSDDAVNIPLLRYVARTGKPVLLSTGMCTMSEVRQSVDAILEEGNDQIILFHCTTNYPTHPESVNLSAMVAMQKEFNLPVGYSDHTLGIDTGYAAAVLGAHILEYHFTHDKNADGPDHMLSKEPEESAQLIAKVRALPVLMGDGIKKPVASEMNTLRNNRKSLVLTADVATGAEITSDNMDIKRPGYGIPCAHYDEVLGKTASRDLKSDEVLTWEDIL